MVFDSWDMFSSSEKELFQRSCRRLLKTTFIVRERDEDSKKIYFFISKNFDYPEKPLKYKHIRRISD